MLHMLKIVCQLHNLNSELNLLLLSTIVMVVFFNNGPQLGHTIFFSQMFINLIEFFISNLSILLSYLVSTTLFIELGALRRNTKVSPRMSLYQFRMRLNVLKQGYSQVYYNRPMVTVCDSIYQALPTKQRTLLCGLTYDPTILERAVYHSSLRYIVLYIPATNFTCIVSM